MTNKHRTNVSNVLIVGSGAAGLRAAIAAQTAGREVIVIGKRMRKDAHTVLAAGGINAALGMVDPEDSWQHHFADTVVEGHFLANPRAVEIGLEKLRLRFSSSPIACLTQSSAEGQSESIACILISA